ncbi:MAG: PilZ domain-containing protein, partial [Candidatus Thiodiazotropha sp. (ex Semelilucina semeliformis)]|nr:PilZ domain-containing protein [Candidatus Thiodiazotropha sp. (ex Semelilucina semeliformis)]
MNDPATNERRRFHRILFDAPTTIKSDGVIHQTTLLDISLKGALAKIPANWQPRAGELVSISVKLDEKDTVINMQALCAHIEADTVGFLCDEIDMDSISLLRRLVELNIG